MEATSEEKPLGVVLFELVEADQGAAFISDGIELLPRDTVLGIARGSLRATERSARKLRQFLREYAP